MSQRSCRRRHSRSPTDLGHWLRRAATWPCPSQWNSYCWIEEICSRLRRFVQRGHLQRRHLPQQANPPCQRQGDIAKIPLNGQIAALPGSAHSGARHFAISIHGHICAFGKKLAPIQGMCCRATVMRTWSWQ
jgi:hypothetical protein